MKLEFRNNSNFWAGLMFLVIGVATILIAKDYRFGSTLRMGPGYLPIVLGIMLTLFGLYILVKGLYRPDNIEGTWSLRALIILPASVVLFGLLMEHAGFIPALAAVVILSAVSGREFKWAEVLLLTLLNVSSRNWSPCYFYLSGSKTP